MPVPRHLSFCRHPTALHAKMCSSSSASGVGDSQAPASLSSELDRGSFQSCSTAPSTSTPNKHVSQLCCAPVCQGMLSPGTRVAPRVRTVALYTCISRPQPSYAEHAPSTLMGDCHTRSMYLSTSLCLVQGERGDGLTYQLHCPSISGPSSQTASTLGSHLQKPV